MPRSYDSLTLEDAKLMLSAAEIRHTLDIFTFDQINKYIDLLRTGEIVGRAVMKF